FARAPSHPDTEKLTTPAADRRSQSRRDRDGRRGMEKSSQAPGLQPGGLKRGLMVQDKLGAIQEHPENVAQGGPGVAPDAPRPDVAAEALALVGARRARQRRQEQR